jgi:hypothetical protein
MKKEKLNRHSYGNMRVVVFRYDKHVATLGLGKWFGLMLP